MQRDGNTASWIKAALATALLLTGGVLSISARAIGAEPAVAACRALAQTDFAQITDAPTQVMEAEVIAAAADVPAHCHVQGYIWPQVGFELQLPSSGWNGRFIEFGCGGMCGTTRTEGKLHRGNCDEALRRGYACIVSDQGHRSTNEGDGNNILKDGLWAYNNLQAQIDYAFRAAHVTAVAGKAITRHYYGKAPKFSYFMGCSGGGRQALVEAQRFPWDFDGIVAMDPAVNICGGRVAKLWNARVTRDAEGNPLFTLADIDVLNKAVIAQCDADDGLEDGIIGDPRTCRVDPAKLRCKNGQKSGCLSQQQVDAASKVYGGPVTSQGERFCQDGLMPGACPPMPGAEGVISFNEDGMSEWDAENFVRYMGFMPPPGPGWKASDFDFDEDYKRFAMVQAIFADNNPDLRRFKAAGGKLIIAQGWHDSGTYLPLNVVDYYETVEKTMGGPVATQEFARLFMMPGRGHCGLGSGAPPGLGGPGANAVDYLGYLEAWVEQDRAPDVMIAAHIEEREVDWSDKASADAFWRDWSDYIRAPKDPSRVRFTRPVYPYPLQARYKGTGDPNDYRNFEPVGPE